MMNLYVWTSEYLKNYSDGTIIVVAESIELARLKAIVEFERYNKEVKHECLYQDGVMTEWAIEMGEDKVVEEERQLFMADIAKEPEIMKNSVLFLGGSW